MAATAAQQQQHRTIINARAQTGFANSAAYDQYRPSYTPSATEELLKQVRVAGKKHARIVDLAAGTGLFTQGIVGREEGFEILAVEPHDGMREVLAAKALPGVTVMAGVADRMPLEDESVDAVIAAQAFHWFATKAAIKDIHRVLRPHGALGMIWNIEDWNAPQDHEASTAWEQKAHDLIWTFDDNEPRFRHQKWRKVFEDQSKSTPLSLIIANEQFFALPLGEHVQPFEVWLPRDKVWERFSTLSHIAVLEGEQREHTRKTFMDALHGPEVETNEKGEVAVHGNTYVVWTTKIPEDGRATLTDVERPGE